MPTEWAKKRECWDAIKAIMPDFPECLPDEVAREPARLSVAGASSDSGSRGSRADLEAIKAAMAIEASAWLDVAAKGRKGRLLKGKLPEICRTLAAYAANGWERRPTVKQARAGLSALALVREAGR